jgi:hypothetical protein
MVVVNAESGATMDNLARIADRVSEQKWLTDGQRKHLGSRVQEAVAGMVSDEEDFQLVALAHLTSKLPTLASRIASPRVEKDALGSMLLDRNQARRGLTLLRAEDFLVKFHRRVFVAMDELSANGQPPHDPLLVSETLQGDASCELEPGKIKAKVAEIVNDIPVTRHLPFYAKHLRASSLKRKQLEIAVELARETIVAEQDITSWMHLVKKRCGDLAEMLRAFRKDFPERKKT